MFKSILRIFICAALFFVCGCASTGPTSKLQVGEQAPFTKFTKLDGNFLLLDELKGKTVIVVFWASWCNYSRPALVRINDYVKSKLHQDNVVVLAVSVDKASDFQRLLDTINYQHLDNVVHCYSGNDVYDEAFMAFDADNLPHIYIIDPAGNLVGEGHSDSVVYEYLKNK